MNYAKRFFFIGIVVFQTLTVVIMHIIDIEPCIKSIPSVNQDFTVRCLRLNDGIFVKVMCHSDDWTIFRNFKVNSVTVSQTKFINCSFAQNRSLIHIFHSMNISYSREIQFENVRSSLRRQNFQNLSVSGITFTGSNFATLLFDMLYDVFRIKSLKIHKTNLDRIPNNFFEDWSRDIDRVDLMGNKLQKIAKNDFTHLPTVDYLSLYQNEITNIEAGAFDDLSKLTTLELSKNRLRTLPSGIFRHLSRLNILYMGENSFEQLPDDLLTIPNSQLGYFRMNFNSGTLKTLPDQFFKNLFYLTNVHLESSQLESLPKNLFTDSSQLKSLALQKNSLKSLPLGFFNNFRKLVSLDLSSNQIVTLPAGIFDTLRDLEDLNISYNHLTSLDPNVFKGLEMLTHLNASHNDLTKVSDGFCRHLQKINVIDFSYNRLTFGVQKSEHASMFEGCETLRKINLSHNNVAKIFAKFAFNWASVDLSFNDLSQLSTEDIKNLGFVGTVNLRNNHISKINFTTLESIAATFQIKYDYDLSSRPLQIALGKNPLHCDCHLIDFVLYMNPHNNNGWKRYVKITSKTDGDAIGDYVTCASPIEFKNHIVHEINPEDLYCTLKTDAAEDACTNDCICREYPAKKVLSVDCSFKNLTRLPSMISNVHNWSIELNMSHNMLSQTPTLTTPYLTNVTSLDLSYNNISTVSSDIFSRNLVDLKLHNNTISRLDETVVKYLVDNDNLRSITLHENPWLCDCKTHDFLNFVQKKTSIYRLDAIACHGSNKKLYKMTLRDICKNAFDKNIADLPEDLKANVLDACKNDCICREYSVEKVLSVDCSSKNLTQLPAMISNVHNWPIQLIMSHNMLKQTPSRAIPYLANVTSLDLSHNNIDTVTMDLFSKNLFDLKLHNNGISRLDETVIKYLSDNDFLRSITLHQNPWVCDCEALRFLHFIQNKTWTYKLTGVMCHGTNRKLYAMTVSDMCKESTAMTVGASLLVAFFGIIIGAVIALYYKYNREIKVWLYSKQWCLWFVTEDELDKDKKYDAFVSFSHKDEDFVENEIVAKLEDGPRPYKLCLHHRDWLAGEWIPVQISQSVEDSRRTIIVLSTSFLESVWGILEFRVAHTQALKEGRARVIIILYGEIENMDELDPELKSYLSLNTYVKWGDPCFWDKLRYSLPHKFQPSRNRTRNARLLEEHIVRQSVGCSNTNAISMSKLVNDSAKLLDSGVNERTAASSEY